MGLCSNIFHGNVLSMSNPSPLSGDGRVLNGETFVADVKYKIRYRHPRIGRSSVAGLPTVELTLSGVTDNLPLSVPLILVLRDGRSRGSTIWARGASKPVAGFMTIAPQLLRKSDKHDGGLVSRWRG